MCAGAGIFHEEYLQAGEEGSEALQVWFNLPASQKLTPPEYKAVHALEIPEVAFPSGAQVRVVAGELAGVQGPVQKTGIQATYLVVTLPTGATITLPAPRSETAFAYVYQGSVRFGEQEVASGKLAIFADNEVSEPEAEEVLATAPDTGEVRFILVRAAPLREPVFQYRSSVMNTVSQIGQAVRDRLRRLGEAMPGRVLLVHGDTHHFRDDEPLPGLQRIEVFGSPHVRWAKARIERTGAKRFSVEPAAQ